MGGMHRKSFYGIKKKTQLYAVRFGTFDFFLYRIFTIVSLTFSPTRACDGGTEDYEWHDVDMSYDEIEALIRLSENN